MMATPESIAAPIEITELNPLMDLLNEINPALQNDPVFQKISGAGGFLRDLVEDPFNYLGAGAGAGLKGASVFLLARRAELEDFIKAVDTDPLLKGDEVLKKSFKKELDKVNKEIAENARLKIQADEMIADPSKFGVSDDLGKVVRDKELDNIDDVIREYINIDPTKKLSNGGPTGDRVEVLGVEALEFPEDLIEYLPPDTEMSMKVGDKYYSRPEDYDALVAEARLEQYAQSQGRNDPDVKFGNNPQFDKKANISGTGIEEAGRNPEYNPDGSFAQEPNIYRYEYDETGKLLQNENYLIGEQSPTMGYYDENADTFVMPGEYGIDAYPKGYNKTTEAHEMMHRPLPGNFSDEISAGNEHLYIADKTNDPEQFERYRLEYYPHMPKRLFDVYYKNVIKRYYDNKFE
jgi:hypothetical protein